MFEDEKRVDSLELGSRKFTIQRNSRKRAVLEVREAGVVVLRVISNPDAPLTDIEPTIHEFIADEALPTPEEAKPWGPAEDKLWRPSEGRKLPDGSLELSVTVAFDNYVTDHGVHRCVERSWWTETDEDLGIEEGSDDDHHALADQVICFIGDELIEGQHYVLLLNVDGPYSSGQSHTHFCYSRKHWPPMD